MLNKIRETLTIRNEEDGFYYNEINPNFFLDCASRQPQIQKNGFAIYRIDGYYLKDGQKVNVEPVSYTHLQDSAALSAQTAQYRWFRYSGRSKADHFPELSFPAAVCVS